MNLPLPSVPMLESARRTFLRQVLWSAGGLGAAAIGLPGFAHARESRGGLSRLGPLRAPDANGICLPEGFTSRVVAVSGERPAAASPYPWHPAPDGGATFATPDGGWVYVNNSEVRAAQGGVGALRFDALGRVTQAYPILSGTTLNCAGGPTPWGTWLSGEEHPEGRVWECDPLGTPADAVVHPALGVFKHEAVAVDPQHKVVYLTEDEPAGRFYRFVCSPSDWPADAPRPALRRGVLQVLQYASLSPNHDPDVALDVRRAQPVVWVPVAQADQAQRAVRSALGAAAPGTPFRGGEGLWYFQGIVYFSTKGDNRIWAYEHATQTVQAIYDFATARPDQRVLSGVDNLTVSAEGDVLVAEDGGNMELCVIRPDRRTEVLLRVSGQDGSEVTGPAFSPDGKRLYFNSQRGARQGLGVGITYEVTLPAG